MKLNFSFNLIYFQLFYLLNLIFIFLLLFVLCEIIYEIRFFFKFSFYFLINLKKLINFFFEKMLLAVYFSRCSRTLKKNIF